MQELKPVLEIVKQRIADGYQLDQITSELTEKGYTKEQIDWISGEVSNKKSKFKKYLLYIAVPFVLLFITISFLNWQLLNFSSG